LRALVMLPLVALSLRWRGFRATQASLRLLTQNATQSPPNAIKVAAMSARMVNAADRHGVVHPSCLAKALTLCWLLARQGVAADLRIGIRKHNEKFQAHAWVEHQGAALNEPEAHHQHYAAFDAAFSSLPVEDR
jgi:hypothetical protein